MDIFIKKIPRNAKSYITKSHDLVYYKNGVNYMYTSQRVILKLKCNEKIKYIFTTNLFEIIYITESNRIYIYNTTIDETKQYLSDEYITNIYYHLDKFPIIYATTIDKKLYKISNTYYSRSYVAEPILIDINEPVTDIKIYKNFIIYNDKYKTGIKSILLHLFIIFMIFMLTAMSIILYNIKIFTKFSIYTSSALNDILSLYNYYETPSKYINIMPQKYLRHIKIIYE